MRVVTVGVLSLVLGLTMLIGVARAADARLFYDITVIEPGTRSQGWRGTLYDRDGQPVGLEPGRSFATNAGEFVGIGCGLPWIPCGFIHADQLRWMQENGGNMIMDSGAWTYRLNVTAECTRSEGWRGDLLHNGRPIDARQKRVRTPMGPFVRKTSPHPWGQTGWFPISWPLSVIAPGHWPCSSD